MVTGSNTVAVKYKSLDCNIFTYLQTHCILLWLGYFQHYHCHWLPSPWPQSVDWWKNKVFENNSSQKLKFIETKTTPLCTHAHTHKIVSNDTSTYNYLFEAIQLGTSSYFFVLNSQGPVVQSVVSLTSSLRVILLTVLVDSMYTILIFLLNDVSSFCTAKATHIFSANNFRIFAYHSM